MTARSCLVSVALLAATAAGAAAHDKEHGVGPAGAVAVLDRPDAAALDYFTDTELLDQTAEPHRFYSDLLAGKVVVLNAFFTRCENSCPMAAGMLLQLQDQLGDRLGSEVHFLSISVDPAYDTPTRLRDYADKLGADPAWHFLTGQKGDVMRVHARIGTFGPTSGVVEPEAESHGNNIYLANLRTGLWKKVFGPAVTIDQLGRELESLMADGLPE